MEFVGRRVLERSIVRRVGDDDTTFIREIHGANFYMFESKPPTFACAAAPQVLGASVRNTILSALSILLPTVHAPSARIYIFIHKVKTPPPVAAPPGIPYQSKAFANHYTAN